MTSSANIPDGFSMKELEILAEAAADREEAEACSCGEAGCDECDTSDAIYDGMTRNELCDKAEAAYKAMNDACGHPLAHKMVMLQILTNLYDWHNRVGQSLIEDRDEQASGWLKDAGKFQVLFQLMESITVDANDFTAEQ